MALQSYTLLFQVLELLIGYKFYFVQHLHLYQLYEVQYIPRFRQQSTDDALLYMIHRFHPNLNYVIHGTCYQSLNLHQLKSD